MGRPKRKEREKLELIEKRQTEILKAAEDLFLKKGLDKTTITDLSEASELSRGALYIYFKSKEEIAFRILVRIVTLFREYMDKELSDAGTDTFAQICAILSSYEKTMQTNREEHKFFGLFNAFFTGTYPEDEFVKEYYSSSQAITEQLVILMRAGQKAGVVRTDMKPELLAGTMLNGLNGLCEKISLRKEQMEVEQQMSMDDVIHCHIEILIHGIRPVTK
jgi:AcrR family transcriptional regulator